MVGRCISYWSSPFSEDIRQFSEGVFGSMSPSLFLRPPWRSLESCCTPQLRVYQSHGLYGGILFLGSISSIPKKTMGFDPPEVSHGITLFPRWRTLKLRHTWTCASETWSPAAAAKTWCNITFLKRFPYKVAPWSVTNGITTPINGQKSMGFPGVKSLLTGATIPVLTGRGHLVTSSGSQISWWACRFL